MAEERASAEHLLLLDTGDALVGGGLGDRTQGEAIVAGMTLMGYDAMALGPKELALGLDTLRQRMDQAGFPILSANAVLDAGGEPLAQPYHVVDIGPQRAAIVGLTRPPDTPLEGIRVLDPRDALSQTLAALAPEADLIIVLTNLPYDQAATLAAALPGIDLVVAALPAQAPSRVVRLPGTGTLVVSAERPAPGHTGRQMGRLAVTVQADGTLAGEAWAAVPMNLFVDDDPEMADLLARFAY